MRKLNFMTDHGSIRAITRFARRACVTGLVLGTAARGVRTPEPAAAGLRPDWTALPTAADPAVAGPLSGSAAPNEPEPTAEPARPTWSPPPAGAPTPTRNPPPN